MTGPVQGKETPGSARTEFNMLTFVFKQLLSQVQTATLVKVIACSNAGTVAPVGTVTVQPMVNQISGNGQPTPHGYLYEVPYFRLQGGTNAIILDPKPGDIGLCVFCSRDISAVKATKAVANPPSPQTQFDWADGLYVGGFLNVTPANYIEFLNSGQINIVSATEAVLQAPTVNLNASTGFNVTGPTDINGTTIDNSGDIVSPGMVSANDIASTTDVTSDAGANSLNAIALTVASISGEVTNISNAKVVLQTASASFPNGYTITAGSGITLTPSGSLLTIAASGGGTVTSVQLASPNTTITIGGTNPITTSGTINVDLAHSGVTAGSYTIANITVDVYGRVTSAANGSAVTSITLASPGSTIAISGTNPITSSGTVDIDLSNTSVVPGSYTSTNLTVDAHGRITAASNGGSGPAPVPGTVPDLYFWFESDNLLYNTAGTVIPVVLNRNPWLPLNGYPNSSASGNGPVSSATTLNGLAMMSCANTPTARMLLGAPASNIGAASTQWTVFVVFKPTGVSATQVFIGAGNAGMLFRINSTAHLEFAKANGSVGTSIGASTGTVSAGTAFQGNGTYNSSTGAFAFRLSRAASGSGTNAVAITPEVDTLFYDRSQPANDLNGLLAALIVYTRVLTSTEITNVENYLNSKWNV